MAHTNARRVEQAGLAAPYDVTSTLWKPTDVADRGTGHGGSMTVRRRSAARSAAPWVDRAAGKRGCALFELRE